MLSTFYFFHNKIQTKVTLFMKFKDAAQVKLRFSNVDETILLYYVSDISLFLIIECGMKNSIRCNLYINMKLGEKVAAYKC